MTAANKSKVSQSRYELLDETRKSEQITKLSIDELRDNLVVSTYHINILEQIINQRREQQSKGGKSRGINKETGENIFEQRRQLAAVWMLREFTKNSDRQFKALQVEFQQNPKLPFKENNLRDVWRNWNLILSEKEKKELLAKFNLLVKKKLQ